MDLPKKRQLEDEDPDIDSDPPESLSRPVSPPRKRKREAQVLRSPWQLTWIRDLPESLNQDAITLKDILGDPLISECWQFNYLHDTRFIMDAFDADTRHLVNVHIVHGFWKREDPNRLALIQEASAFRNVELHTAFMPEMFGTHHSKMMVLFRHDDTAQVIIHTANMIPKDWTNMTNAVWKSPPLPLMPASAEPDSSDQRRHPFGSGERFKVDLLNYLKFYDRRRPTVKSLVERLSKHDFSAVKAVLVASVPGRHDANDSMETSWGWSALKRNLHEVPCSEGESEVAIQISSIATLGGKDDWLKKTLFDSLSRSTTSNPKMPNFKVVFPTADEIRNCLEGYPSGGSIHTRIQSAQQAKQLDYLRPIFHHWANDSSSGRCESTQDSEATLDANSEVAALPEDVAKFDSGRARAAPHIKTYIRYNNKNSIDWALLTSANLSKQAWGEAAQNGGDFRISSWEIGILVWPDLIEKGSLMVPSFRSDVPERGSHLSNRSLVGVRIPYDMPLQKYGSGEIPWVTTMAHREPDRFGNVWMG